MAVGVIDLLSAGDENLAAEEFDGLVLLLLLLRVEAKSYLLK